MAEPAPSQSTKPSRRKLQLGEIALSEFYRKGAVIANEQGEHLLITEGYREQPDGSGKIVNVTRCSPSGDAIAEEYQASPHWAPNTLQDGPATFLFQQRYNSGGDRSVCRGWDRRVTLVKSASDLIPDGVHSTDPSLLLVPFGRDTYGKMLGELTKSELAALAENEAKHSSRGQESRFLPAIRKATTFSSAVKNRAPRIGDIDLSEFYHEGAVIQGRNGTTLTIIRAWGYDEAAKDFNALAALADKDGNRMASVREGPLVSRPQTFMSEGGSKEWQGPVTLLRSKNPRIPDGVRSDSASLLVIPYGKLFGTMIGNAAPEDRALLARSTLHQRYKEALETAPSFPTTNPPQIATSRMPLTDAARLQLYRAQDDLVCSVPLVAVMDSMLGQAPDHVRGDSRKYRVGDQLITLDTKRNRFGSLNHYKFVNLAGRKGSTNNAIDLVLAVRELEGQIGMQRREARDLLVKHFGLQPQLDSLRDDFVRREVEAMRAGKLAEHIAKAKAEVSFQMKEAEGRRSTNDEPEVEFDLATGTHVNATPADVEEAVRRGGGFAEQEHVWPAARKYLVEERRLDPGMIDLLHQHKYLYATRRHFVGPAPHFRVQTSDVIVAPVFGFKTGKIVAVDTKPLPRRPGEKTEGRNHGKSGQGGFMIGAWGPDTKRVVLTEGFIKACAFYMLHAESMNIGPETCIVSRSGANSSLDIVPLLKEWGAEAVAAFDNDFVGRDKSGKFKAECDRQGVPCTEMFVEPSEVTVEVSPRFVPGFHDHERTERIQTQLKEFADKNGIPWAEERDKRGTVTGLRFTNTGPMIGAIEDVLREDRRLANQLHQEEVKRLNLTPEHASKRTKTKWVSVTLHHKDWDDIVKKGPFVPRVPTLRAEAAAPSSPPPGGGGQAPTHDALILAREKKDATTAIMVGTGEEIYDVQVPVDQSQRLASFIAGKAPRRARITRATATAPGQLIEVADSNGNYVPSATIIGAAPDIEPASAEMQRAWRNPRTPEVKEALLSLRGAPVSPLPPLPSPEQPPPALASSRA